VGDGPSPTGADDAVVVGADEQVEVEVDLDRWVALATAVLRAEEVTGELTLSFVDRTEIAALNTEHLGHDGDTDVLSFPLDDEPPVDGTPRLLGDVVVCPAVAAGQAAGHAGTVDDEIALLVVHGVLHVLGHDHAEADERALMRRREVELLEAHHWRGPAPSGFRQEQEEPA
jgi:probable rRNA maturation factor